MCLFFKGQLTKYPCLRPEGEHCIQTWRVHQHGFSCSTARLTLPAETPRLNAEWVWLTGKRRPKWKNSKRGFMLAASFGGAPHRTAVPASPAPPPPPYACPPAAPPLHLHPAAPHLPPLPCVRPSRCSRAASTSFTLRHRAPGESQPPLVDR